MKSEIKKLEDSTISIAITIPWLDVEKAREGVINELTQQVAAPGFRRGKVPKKIAREKLDKEKVNEEVLRKILPDAYVAAVKENNLNPIINPKIHVEGFDEGTDLVFTAQTCEEPEVDLKNYKEEVKNITAKSKIIVPGKEEQKPSMEEILDALIKNTDVKVSNLLIEHETNRLLSQFIDELKTLGLSVEQYLQSKGKKGEELRKEYEERAKNDLKLEFLLRKIADIEKIEVSQKDVEDALGTIKDEQQKKQAQENSYLLSAIVRQQKTLDFLSKL